MKYLTLTVILINLSHCFAQDKRLIESIDSLVQNIQSLKIPFNRDTIIQDLSELNMKTTTVTSFRIDNEELLEYENHSTVKSQINSEGRTIVSSSKFYFHKNNLIKVEEFLIDGNKKHEAIWYYSDNKCIFQSLNSEKANSRAPFLLELSKTYLNIIDKK